MRYLLGAGSVLVALIAVFGVFGAMPGSASPQTTHIVYANDIDFCGASGASCPQPYAINVEPGEQVVFRDGGNGPAHSVTQCTNATFNNCVGAGFDSGIQNLAPGQDYFPSPLSLGQGTYYYRCNVHLSGMTGIIQVGGPTPAPTPSPTLAPTPTPTSAPTSTATSQPTPSPSAPPDGSRGDLDCDGDIDIHDVEELLSHFAGVGGHGGHHGLIGSSGPSGSECPIPGTILPDRRVGELNCDDALTVKDAMVLLYHLAGLEYPLPSGCPGVN
jgi:plastocyanin